MKVSAYINFDKEVEIYIGSAEVMEALRSLPEPVAQRDCFEILNTTIGLARKVPLELMSDTQRRLVSNAFMEQAKRFAVPPNAPASTDASSSHQSL